MRHYHLVGIGGTGMNGLAQMFVHDGINVSGSDRSYDRGENAELFNKLERLGIKIYPQDGRIIGRGINKVIVSSAIENNNPDLISAKRYKIPISKRQDELKSIFRRYSGIAVAGTSGKTTVVGMIGCIFDVAGQDISVINGGMMRNYVTKKDIGNVHIGRLPFICIETDESEGDLRGYNPDIGVLTNIGHDHMSVEKLKKIYNEFAEGVKDVFIVNSNIKLNRKYISFGIDGNADIKADHIELYPSYSIFKIGQTKIKLNVPGIHNIYNALAAAGVANAWGISMKQIDGGLERFKGIKRRFETVGEVNGVRIIDDYAHNPDKIRAVLKTVKLGNGRVIAVYQPHGYKPTRMLLNELAQAFADNLIEGDFLFIPKIYYGGGKVAKNVSSRDLVREIKKRNKSLNVIYIPKRDGIKKQLQKIVKTKDTILVMGARDNTLQEWARGLLR